LLSDSIASLPLNPYTFTGGWKSVNYEDGKFNILNVQPNPFMGSYIFKKLIVVNLLLSGNAYILIDRDKMGKVLSLTLLHPEFMNVQILDGDIKYLYSLSSTGMYDKSQIIHIMNYTVDGLTGISTIQYAADSLEIAYSSEAHAKNFWKSGGNMSGILRPVAGSTMNPLQASTAKSAMVTQLNSDLGGSSNSVVVLGNGLEYQPISVNPKDSQLLESRQFNVNEICRFFGVPPTLAFSETGKFSTAEQQSLDFLNNSLTPLIEKIESEMFRKLYLPSEWNQSELKFDVENIMRLDAVSRADYYSKMFQVGGFTTNEIREKINAAYPVKGGNRAFIQVNLQPTDALISEQVSVNPEAPIDNQVK
jgi:HK97 family phage portal protein